MMPDINGQLKDLVLFPLAGKSTKCVSMPLAIAVLALLAHLISGKISALLTPLSAI
ncbi:MAG: hypothetical protein JKY01_11375 [Pseudomonadales bacterium]|nr:hypothetical protein [Pseudomonadales bacterium]